MKSKTITINPEQEGKRLDVFLTEHLKSLSRSAIQKMITKHAILVNDSNVSKHYFIKTGDVVLIDQANEIKQETSNKLISSINVPESKIVFYNEEFIIVNKPSGLVVHPDSSHVFEESLIGQIISKFPDIKKIGEESYRPGIVHRLDKEVSGLMVIARTQEMFNCLKKQFKIREISKEYIALVHGDIPEDEIEINFPLKRKKTGFMAALPENEGGLSAKTIVSLKQAYINYSLVNIKIITGRMHQIRVHLNAYNHPIVGEKVYISKGYKKANFPSNLSRIFLHSKKLSFKDLSNQKQEFEIPLPDDLLHVLANLKLKSDN